MMPQGPVSHGGKAGFSEEVTVRQRLNLCASGGKRMGSGDTSHCTRLLVAC